MQPTTVQPPTETAPAPIPSEAQRLYEAAYRNSVQAVEAMKAYQKLFPNTEPVRNQAQQIMGILETVQGRLRQLPV